MEPYLKRKFSNPELGIMGDVEMQNQGMDEGRSATLIDIVPKKIFWEPIDQGAKKCEFPNC